MAKLTAAITEDLLKEPKRLFRPDGSIISSGLIDSSNPIDLSLIVEDHSGIRIDATELSSNAFDTLEQPATLIKTRQELN